LRKDFTSSLGDTLVAAGNDALLVATDSEQESCTFDNWGVFHAGTQRFWRNQNKL